MDAVEKLCRTERPKECRGCPMRNFDTCEVDSPQKEERVRLWTNAHLGCPICGEKLNGDEEYCPRCGKAVRG